MPDPAMASNAEPSRAAPAMDHRFASGGLVLSGHLATPGDGVEGNPGLVICHGFPTRGREAPQSAQSFPELADRIATELGWVALAMNFRGCGRSDGSFSLQGWMDDIGAGVEHLRQLGVSSVWLAGYGSGGSLAICEGARNAHVRGVAAMGAQADFDDWARNPRQLLLHARRVQVIKDPGYPSTFDRWSSELKSVRPLDAAAELAPRRLLVIHGERDDLTPPDDGRSLAAAHGAAEFRLISGAGHELRHDPRAVAVFLGWLARQRVTAVSRTAAPRSEPEAPWAEPEDSDSLTRTDQLPSIASGVARPTVDPDDAPDAADVTEAADATAADTADADAAGDRDPAGVDERRDIG